MKQNWELFKSFFKIGMFTFGGGFAMIPLIEKEIVENKNWLTDNEIIQLFAVSQSIPGAIAINTSTLVGYKINKRLGAICATIGVILPSFIIILLIATMMSGISENVYVEAGFKGIGAAVILLIFHAAKKIYNSFETAPYSIIIMLVTILIVTFTNVSPIFMIIAGGLYGLFFLKENAPTESNETDNEGDELVWFI